MVAIIARYGMTEISIVPTEKGKTMSKYYKAEDVLALFSEEKRPLNWTDSEAEIQAQNDFDCYKGMIESLPTIEVSEDCISREWLEEQYWQTLIPKGMINTDVDLGINIGIEKMYKTIKDAPSAVPITEKSSEAGELIDSYKAGYEAAMIEVVEAHPNINKVGKWLRKDGRVWSRCSVCGSGSSFETNYCGNCGAAMEGHDVDVSE